MPNTQPQPKTERRYNITANRKGQVASDGGLAASITFVCMSTGYKEAWSDAREMTRTGRDSLKDLDGKDVKLPAGQYTVVSVFTIDKATGGGRKSKIVSAADFIKAARAENITVKKELIDFAVKMGVDLEDHAPAAPAEAAA